MSRHIALLLILLCIASTLLAQSPCPQMPVLARSSRANIFTPELEHELGEIAAQQLAISTNVIEDDELVLPLRKIGERILSQMPSSPFQFRFFIVDEPYANAFTLPGGRVYVTRKLIMATRSEDELAGVLAHEIGHDVNHDGAVRMTYLFDVILNVKTLHTREDLDENFQKLLESWRRKQIVDDVSDEDKAQLSADRVSVFAMARAGYNPRAVADFWDRFTERKGRQGNWFSDIFGATRPETKRLREFASNAATVPQSCFQATRSDSTLHYQEWQQAVLGYAGFGKRESVPRLISKSELDPPLRSEITHFRFSREGKYILAQDQANIFVLQREPLKFIFLIPARDASPAQFSPDSKYVVFHTASLRVEKWSIEQEQVYSSDEVYVYGGCLRSKLSPDGRVLACLKPDTEGYFPLQLRLVDVESGENIVTKQNFIGPVAWNWQAYMLYLALQEDKGPIIAMDFSPDGRYFLAGREPAHFGYDLVEKHELKLPGSLKSAANWSFAFLDDGRLIGVDGAKGLDSKLYRFPSGELIQSGLRLGERALHSPSAGDFVIVRPLIDAPVGVMDLKENRIFLGNKTNAIDIYQGTWVSERANGEVALYNRASAPRPIASVVLPRATLTDVRDATFSPDLRFLGISDRTRGMLWDVQSGGGIPTSGFRGLHLTSDGGFVNFAPRNQYASNRSAGQSEKDYLIESGNQPGNIIARISLAPPAMTEVAKYQKRNGVVEAGSVYVVSIPKEEYDHPKTTIVPLKGGSYLFSEYKGAISAKRDVTIEAHDASSGQLLWTRFFGTSPGIIGSDVDDRLVVTWDLSTKDAKQEIKADPEAAKLVEGVWEKQGSYLVAVLDARTGKSIAHFPVDTGNVSFVLTQASAGANYVVLSDSNGRVLVYNMKGERKARLFGTRPVISDTADLMAIQTEPGRLALYDLKTMNKREEYTLPSWIASLQFSADGKRLALVTDTQKLYIIDTSAPTPTKRENTE